MEVGKLTVFHSCLSTCVKRQVSLEQAFRLCLCTVMLTANCGGTNIVNVLFWRRQRKMGRLSKSLVGVNIQGRTLTFHQDVLGWLG